MSNHEINEGKTKILIVFDVVNPKTYVHMFNGLPQSTMWNAGSHV